MGSYFVLFFKLFVDNYCLKRKDAPQLPGKPSASLGTERKESTSLLPRKASVSLDALRKASEKALDTVRKASERTLDDLVPNLNGDDTVEGTQDRLSRRHEHSASECACVLMSVRVNARDAFWAVFLDLQ